MAATDFLELTDRDGKPLVIRKTDVAALAPSGKHMTQCMIEIRTGRVVYATATFDVVRAMLYEVPA